MSKTILVTRDQGVKTAMFLDEDAELFVEFVR